MRILCNRVFQPRDKKIESFLNDVELNGLRSLVGEVCVPDSYAVGDSNLDSIDRARCTGCLACIDENEIEYITTSGTPTNSKDSNRKLSDLVRRCFRGEYVKPQFSTRLARHTAKNENRITNPLVAYLFWRLSAIPDRIFISCSPTSELSITIPRYSEEREGHLDITIASPDHSLAFVLEGKKSLTDLLSSEDRNQWNRYSEGIDKLNSRLKYRILFSYAIGGRELPLYPEASNAPHHARRGEFYNFVVDGYKHFISIESLRALRAHKIAIDPSWSWEDYLPDLFDNPSFLGLVSGGVIYLREEKPSLEKAPWIR